MKNAIIISLFLFPLLLKSQGSVLNVFSDDDTRFRISLNGILQDTTYQSNIQVGGLNGSSYDLKIHFEESFIQDLHKKYLYVKDNETGNDLLLSYAIVNKSNGYKLRYRNATPINVNNTAVENNQEVIILNTNPNLYSSSTTVVSQTSSTTTTTSSSSVNQTGNANASVGINMGGVTMGVGININDGFDNNGGFQDSETVTTTTYTTQETYGGVNQPVIVDDGCMYGTSNADFVEMEQLISAKSFSDTKMSLAKQITKNNCLTSSQVVRIMNQFSFEDDKLTYAKYAYNYVFDPNNYYKVSSAFEFESSTEELNNAISN